MKRCIFCGKSEDEFDSKNMWSDEHIIPECLGNSTLKISTSLSIPTVFVAISSPHINSCLFIDFLF